MSDNQSNLLKFTEMVGQQLKDAYSVDVSKVEKATDLHGQNKAILKIGDLELWFRNGDESITIDGIKDSKAIGTVKVNAPICHLRTSAMLVDKFELSAKEPKPVKEEKEEKPKEESSPKGEPENFVEEFYPPTGKMALVDASVLDGLENELVEEAIMIPVKHRDAVFEVKATYDDTIMRQLVVQPKEVDEGGVKAIKQPKHVDEGISPLSHDDSIQRRLRKTVKQISHLDGSNVPARLPDPIKKGVVKRDKSSKDGREKKRQYRESIIAAINGDNALLGALELGDLMIVENILNGILHAGILADKMTLLIEEINKNIRNKKTEETSKIVEYVEWMRTINPKSQLNQPSQPNQNLK